MPGKQMSIDADLNAGVIDQETAKKRREELAQESDFFGSMDGASKFVSGDAIAGLLILVINLVGGLAIGIGQHDLSFAEAGRYAPIINTKRSYLYLVSSTVAPMHTNQRGHKRHKMRKKEDSVFVTSAPLVAKFSFQPSGVCVP
jgi:hypothetical protein